MIETLLDDIIDELEKLKKYMSAPVVYPDEESGYFHVKSGGTKQEVYRRFFNSRYFLDDLLYRLKDWRRINGQ